MFYYFVCTSTGRKEMLYYYVNLANFSYYGADSDFTLKCKKLKYNALLINILSSFILEFKVPL